MSTCRIITSVAALALGCLGAKAEEIRARGVNPADNDTRIDVILKHNWLSNGAGIFTTTLKFDYRVTQEIGVNLEFPLLGHFRSSSPAPGVPGLDDLGVGDIFARLRYIKGVGAGTFGATSLGGAVELVFPTASEPTLGNGTYQINATGLLVQAWSPSLITAFVAKTVQSVAERHGRLQMQENTLRVVQALILPGGRFMTFDGKYNWETVNRRDLWWELQAEFGMMLDMRTSVSVAVSRKWGDRDDRGAASLNLKRFF